MEVNFLLHRLSLSDTGPNASLGPSIDLSRGGLGRSGETRKRGLKGEGRENWW